MAKHYPGINLNAINDPEVRDALKKVDDYLRDTGTSEGGTPTSAYNWDGTGTAPDGYIRQSIGGKSVLLPYWNE